MTSGGAGGDKEEAMMILASGFLTAPVKGCCPSFPSHSRKRPTGDNERWSPKGENFCKDISTLNEYEGNSKTVLLGQKQKTWQAVSQA